MTIVVTGATGFLGKRVCLGLEKKGVEYTATSLSLGLDLRDRTATLDYFKKLNPDYVLNCASFVGGIQFGLKFPADTFQNNMPMIANLFEAAHEAGVKRFVNPVSNCVYPAEATYFKEDEIWDGPLHESVMVYGALRKMSWVGSFAYARQYGLDTLNLVLSNMYGPEDHFEEERSHALGALIKKFVDAQNSNAPSVTVWGSGKPVREWLHVDDGAEAMIRGMDCKSDMGFVNVGVGQGISILEMAEQISQAVGYNGKIVLDTSKADGAPHKTVDGASGEKLLDWSPSTSLKQGISDTVDWYKKSLG